MDSRLIALKRQWAGTQDPEDGHRYLNECLRRGETELRLRVLLSGLFEEAGINEQGLEVFRHLDSGIDMVTIPAGTFEMGADHETASAVYIPVHTVTFSRPFLMSASPVTQGQWTKMMGENPSRHQGSSSNSFRDGRALDPHGAFWDEHPVESVSWDDVQQFCDRTGLRLPTEAMYEYCARAGSATLYAHGDSPTALNRFAWFGQSHDSYHRAVRSFLPNQWGLYDMAGNVLSWTQCIWHPNYVGAPSNGFVAWGDAAGYNHALWVTGTLRELTLVGFGGNAIRDVLDEDDVEAESDVPARRRSRYGLSVKLAPPAGRREHGGPTSVRHPGRISRPGEGLGSSEPVQEAELRTPTGEVRILRQSSDPTRLDGRPQSGATSSQPRNSRSRRSDVSPSTRSESLNSRENAGPGSASHEVAPGHIPPVAARSVSATPAAEQALMRLADSEWSGLDADLADDIPLNVPSVSLRVDHSGTQSSRVLVGLEAVNFAGSFLQRRYESSHYQDHPEVIGFRVVWG